MINTTGNFRHLCRVRQVSIIYTTGDIDTDDDYPGPVQCPFVNIYMLIYFSHLEVSIFCEICHFLQTGSVLLIVLELLPLHIYIYTTIL